MCDEVETVLRIYFWPQMPPLWLRPAGKRDGGVGVLGGSIAHPGNLQVLSGVVAAAGWAGCARGGRAIRGPRVLALPCVCVRLQSARSAPQPQPAGRALSPVSSSFFSPIPPALQQRELAQKRENARIRRQRGRRLGAPGARTSTTRACGQGRGRSTIRFREGVFAHFTNYYFSAPAH